MRCMPGLVCCRFVPRVQSGIGWEGQEGHVKSIRALCSPIASGSKMPRERNHAKLGRRQEELSGRSK
jgi:hypothetical protein